MSTHLLLAPSQGGTAQRTYLAPLLRLPPLHLPYTGWGVKRKRQRDTILISMLLLIHFQARCLGQQCHWFQGTGENLKKTGNISVRWLFLDLITHNINHQILSTPRSIRELAKLLKWVKKKKIKTRYRKIGQSQSHSYTLHPDHCSPSVSPSLPPLPSCQSPPSHTHPHI